MTVAVSCNLSDGVILGVDSAVTLPSADGTVLKVYENAEKLFQLGNLPVGVATFGMAAFASRGIGSYLREFETTNEKLLSGEASVGELVEELRLSFLKVYYDAIVPQLEAATGKKFKDIPPEQVPALGLVVGGFSPKSYLSEVWQILVPQQMTPGSGQIQRDQGEFGTNWFATFEPIRRYILGFDPNLVGELVDYLKGGAAPSAKEQTDIRAILAKYEYQIPFAAMPLEEGVAHTRFLVELAINHHRYAFGAPVVGGKVKIGKVTYKGERFQILDS